MRLLRKYVNNRGSALFMVISTMTALMISCMAMYFSVVSSRSTQYAIFNQQQSRQVSMSINDAVVAAMNDGKIDLGDAIAKLEVGEKLTTGGNGFSEFEADGTREADNDLGAYRMEITRLPDETVNGVVKKVYDMVVTSSVNGANNVYHNIIYYEESAKDNPPAPTQVFAATGYVPNDVFLDGGRFITDVFFDNEMTVVNAYGGKNMELWGNLSTGGSLTVHGYLIPNKKRTLTFAIRNTYTANFNQPVGFAPSPYEKSTVLIGGNCVLNENNGFSNANVYILGDLIIRGNPDLDTSNYFVDGDVIVESRQTAWGSMGFWVNLKNVYANGIVDASNNSGGGINGGLAGSLTNGKGKTAKSWNQKINGTNYLNVSEMIDLLEEKTATNQYYKWVINDYAPTKDKYVKELDESRPSTVVKKKIHFSQDYTNPIPVVELKYSNSEKGCIIEDVTCDKGNTAFNDIALIIDTGEDEDNVYTIRVKPNRDFDGDGTNETFSWYPFYTQDSSTVMSILVKGRGSVVVDVPKGVTYQDLSFQKFMHYGWYVLGGGTEFDGPYGHIYKQGSIDNSNADVNLEQFIHKDCKAGDGCSYTEGESTNVCSSCGGKKKTVKCSIHGSLNEFCPACQPDKKNNHVGECVNHVGRKEIDQYLASHAALKSRLMGSDGKLIYPTTNIFLVSCDESANIRLSLMQSGETIIQNSFFGYVYAPYMTFKAYGNNSGGGMVRLMGGMTVSDYIIDDSMSMIACWPEKMPTDLMSDECKQNKLDGVAGKGWKISLKAH